MRFVRLPRGQAPLLCVQPSSSFEPLARRSLTSLPPSPPADEWGQKAKRRHTTGTGRMQHLKGVSRRFKNGCVIVVVVRPPRAPTDELPSPAASARAPPPPARSRRSKLLRPCEPLCPPRSRPYLPSPRLGLSRSPLSLDLALSPSSGINNLPPLLSPAGESASLLCVRSVLDGHWAGRKGDERGVGSRAGLGGRVGTERGARSERDVWVETGVVVVASCAALAVCERDRELLRLVVVAAASDLCSSALPLASLARQRGCLLSMTRRQAP